MPIQVLINGFMTKDQYVQRQLERRAAGLLEAFFQSLNAPPTEHLTPWEKGKPYAIACSWEHETVKDLVFSFLQDNGWDPKREEAPDCSPDSRTDKQRECVVVENPIQNGA
jgi:hypothetical protein